MERVSLKLAAAHDQGGFTAIASAPTLDRDGEIIDPGAFEPLPASVPVHVDHTWTVASVVGRGVPRYGGGQLMLDVTFGPDAPSQEVRGKVLAGLLDSVSVGFMNAQRTRGGDGRTHITAAELVEVSIVSIPSNREARITSVRGAGSAAAIVAQIRHEAADALLAMARAEIREARTVLTITERNYQPEARARVDRSLRRLGIGTSEDDRR